VVSVRNLAAPNLFLYHCVESLTSDFFCRCHTTPIVPPSLTILFPFPPPSHVWFPFETSHFTTKHSPPQPRPFFPLFPSPTLCYSISVFSLVSLATSLLKILPYLRVSYFQLSYPLWSFANISWQTSRHHRNSPHNFFPPLCPSCAQLFFPPPVLNHLFFVVQILLPFIAHQIVCGILPFCGLLVCFPYFFLFVMRHMFFPASTLYGILSRFMFWPSPHQLPSSEPFLFLIVTAQSPLNSTALTL